MAVQEAAGTLTRATEITRTSPFAQREGHEKYSAGGSAAIKSSRKTGDTYRIQENSEHVPYARQHRGTQYCVPNFLLVAFHRDRNF
jgi:hypothetical protein